MGDISEFTLAEKRLLKELNKEAMELVQREEQAKTVETK